MPLAVRVPLVQSAAGPNEKLRDSRVRERSRNAPYGRWDAPGVGVASSAGILDLKPTHLHNLSAGQWEASGAERGYLHIPQRPYSRAQ